MEQISIGRAPECSLNIPESFLKVSNEHANIHLVDGIITFYDHSSNGTIINGQLVHNSSRVIKQGDRILLADSYELKWSEIEQYFPSLHRFTERFDGSQIATNNRETERFDNSTIFTAEKQNNEVLSIDFTEGKAGQLNEFTQAEIEEIMEKWNMGAFLSSWVWAMANHIYWPLLIIPISIIPYFGQVASVFLCTYLGLNGYRLAWSKDSAKNFKTFVRKQNKWTLIGVFLFMLFLITQVISIYFIL